MPTVCGVRLDEWLAGGRTNAMATGSSLRVRKHIARFADNREFRAPSIPIPHVSRSIWFVSDVGQLAGLLIARSLVGVLCDADLTFGAFARGRRFPSTPFQLQVTWPRRTTWSNAARVPAAGPIRVTLSSH